MSQIALERKNVGKQFSLFWMFVVITIVACGLGSILTFRMQGLVTYIAILLAILILVAPAKTPLLSRTLILFMGTATALVSWCVLHGMFGSDAIGQRWYGGDLDEIGGWASGILVGAWRAAIVFDRDRLN